MTVIARSGATKQSRRWLAKQPFEGGLRYLAHCISWQGIHRSPHGRHLVVSQLGLEPVSHVPVAILLMGLPGILPNAHRPNPLAPLLIGDAKHRNLGDVVSFEEHALDLGRRDLEAAAFEDVCDVRPRMK